MEKEQPYDPFEFDEDSTDKTFREGFVMDTGMDAGNASTPAQPRIGDVPEEIEVKEKPKKKPKKRKLTTKQKAKKTKKAIKEKLDEISLTTLLIFPKMKQTTVSEGSLLCKQIHRSREYSISRL